MGRKLFERDLPALIVALGRVADGLLKVAEVAAPLVKELVPAIQEYRQRRVSQ
jgi:hypothetical protein